MLLVRPASGLARALLAAALLLSLGACAIPAQQGSAPVAAPVPVSTLPMSTDEALAVKAVGTFWARRFPSLFNAQYSPPRVAGGYRGRTGPTCGGEPSIPFNAVYCPAGDFVAWDTELIRTGARAIGDAWIYLIIAHEWGHAIQARLDQSLVSVAAELQADCLAGAAIQGATADKIIRLEPGDERELSDTLVKVADQFPWTSTSDHGDARQRITFFNRGSRGGVAACIRT